MCGNRRTFHVIYHGRPCPPSQKGSQKWRPLETLASRGRPASQQIASKSMFRQSAGRPAGDYCLPWPPIASSRRPLKASRTLFRHPARHPPWGGVVPPRRVSGAFLATSGDCLSRQRSVRIRRRAHN